MARYFFHTDNGGHRLDAEGVELPGRRAAHLAATQLLGELIADRPEEFWRWRSLTVTVTDAEGRIELVLTAGVVTEAPDNQPDHSPA